MFGRKSRVAKHYRDAKQRRQEDQPLVTTHEQQAQLVSALDDIPQLHWNQPRITDWHDVDELYRYARRLLVQSKELQRRAEQIMLNTEALTKAVEANTAATQSAVTAITDAASAQPAVDAATASVEANTTALTNAVTPPAAPAA